MKNSPIYTDYRQQAITELLYALHASDWRPDPEIVDAILEWHMRAVTKARSELSVPGLAESSNPKVEQVLQKYYTQRTKTTIDRLAAENVRLKQQVMAAADCLKFYASGATDGGTHAKSVLNPKPASEGGA